MNKIKTSYGTIISFTLIVSTILMPLSFLPKKAEAQLGTFGSISGYTTGLAPAIARLPQCQKELGSGIKKLFNGVFGSGETGGSVEDFNIDMTTGNPTPTGNPTSITDSSNSLEEKSSSLTIQATVPAISDKEVSNQLKKVNTNLKEILGDTNAINENSTCIQSIGRLIIKMLLQKLTLSTVNWINSGFDGSPSFIQDPGKFFGDIADNEILQFGIEINGINPYSQDWLKNQVLAYKTKFADNARYSLNDLIQQTNPEYSAATFQQDFSMGGWDAWTAMTQVPANNPLGFKLMADNEIQKRLAGTSQSVAQNTRDALQAANGFLGDQRCISPGSGQIDYNVTWSEYEAGLKATPPIQLCSSWEYVTPGKMIADYATQVTGYQNNSLLNVQDLNDAVAAISDAILNQFSTSIYEKGFANLDYKGIDGVLVFKDTGNGDYRTQTEKDFMPSQLSSSWLQANPDFDIRKDLTQALIDEQRTYSDKLALQNKELMSTTDGKDYNIEECPDGWTGTYPDCTGPVNATTVAPGTVTKIIGGGSLSYGACPSGWTGTYPNCKGPGGTHPGVSNAYGLMPAIYQLDYCIPGPHPGWQDDSRKTLATKLNSITPAEQQSPNIAGSIANGAIGIGLNFVPYAGPVLSSLFGVLTGSDEVKNQSTNTRLYYTHKFFELTGFEFQAVWSKGEDPKDANMSSQEGLFYVLNSTLDRYINIMNKTYFSSPDMLPTISAEAEKEFNQLPGYNQIIKDNKNKILAMKTTVSILGDIKNAVDDLNNQLESGQISNDEYENKLKPQINAFGRLSADMVNGDDIAAADDLAKQIVLKKDYIYKNLLKGPYGCEAWLENKTNIKPFLSAGPGIEQTWDDWSNFNVNSVKRMTYPFPIIYDYNQIPAGATIPDPWGSGYDSGKLPKMPIENGYDKWGPGFLSFVYFAASFNGNHTYGGSERLHLGDIINNYEPCGENVGPVCNYTWVSLGKSNYFHEPPHGDLQGLFEKTIGIY